MGAQIRRGGLTVSANAVDWFSYLNARYRSQVVAWPGPHGVNVTICITIGNVGHARNARLSRILKARSGGCVPEHNPIVTKYMVVDWKGQECVVNIETRKEADHLAEYHQRLKGAPCRVEEYKDYKYICVRRVDPDETEH